MNNERNNIPDDIQKDFQNLFNKVKMQVDKVEEAKLQLQQEMGEFLKIKKKLETTSSQAKSKIKLNVGGKLFVTSLETLTMLKNTFFSCMFSEQFNTQPDEDGEYFIDRNPEYFHIILDYLRNPTKAVNLTEMTKKQIEDFYYEVDFYSIHSLMKDQIVEDVKFDVLEIGKELKADRLSDTKFRITKSAGNSWNASVCFTPCKKWKVTMVQNCQYVMCGVAKQNSINVESSNYGSAGYCVYSNTGGKYYISNLNNTSYGPAFYQNTNTAIMTLENGNLSFVINGTSFGNAYTGLDMNELVPIFDVHSSNACFDVEFLE